MRVVTKYLDMLCCLIDLKTEFDKTNIKRGGSIVDKVWRNNPHSFTFSIFPKYIKQIEKYNNPIIKSLPILNEYIIQQILYNYISNFHNNLLNFVINFTDLKSIEEKKNIYRDRARKVWT